MKPMASVSYNIIQKISSLRSIKFCQQNKEKLNNFESILMEIQKVLIWDDPFVSCCCVVIVNIVFWLIIYLDLKFYGIIFTALLMLTCEQLWMEYFFKYFTKNNPNSANLVSESVELSDKKDVEVSTFFNKGLIMLKEFYERVKFLRKSKPGKFCVLSCLCFLFLGVIGRSSSSIIVFYILLMLIMTVPGVLNHFLPPYVIKSLSDLFYSSRKESNVDNDDEVEPYLPDTSEEALELLRLAGDSQESNIEHDEDSNDMFLDRISERISDTTESVYSKSSFYPESVLMPSPENSMDLWDLDSKEKTDSDETESQGISFQSKHFDGDSSEEEFVRGLDLSEKTSKKFKKNKIQPNQQNNSNLTIVDKKLLTDLKQKDSTESFKESSSDTDSFELISEEDM